MARIYLIITSKSLSKSNQTIFLEHVDIISSIVKSSLPITRYFDSLFWNKIGGSAKLNKGESVTFKESTGLNKTHNKVRRMQPKD